MIYPETIEEVIVALNDIIEKSKIQSSRMGYFPALYKRVTEEVKNKIEEGYFDDAERMEQLDIIFANRYLKAYHQYMDGDTCTNSWKLTFDVAKYWKPSVIQHLFLGMNAHISLDLGIAAALVCPGEDIEKLHNDFNKINEILASLVDKVQRELATIWPPFKLFDFMSGKFDEALADFGMEIARDAAWKVALEYAFLDENGKQEFLEKRDEIVTNFGRKLYKPGWPLGTLLLIIRLTELGTVNSKIKKLNK
ncbi:DUF5995 family protein [Fulvivirgaceae bacterium BMA10]|uniref:DUF5995 family protein n=1 Tax=Splendidivirga corallicola TaxID=3051826 RepID=A0ABT8KUX4_9BACT|nr:DUF5995 family protein [Fulvivirgaceae bacterium BMA10]